MLGKPKPQPADLPAIPAELLEQFDSGPMTAKAINAATPALKKALIERDRSITALIVQDVTDQPTRPALPRRCTAAEGADLTCRGWART